MPDFCHLHCHTQFSLLDGASDITTMMEKAASDGQKAVALTDHGNMFGAFKFVREANKAGVKPIIGCEFYLVEDRHKKSFLKSKGEKDRRYHQLLLAKNETGYQNISKMCSIGFIEGLYSKFPRIDKEIIQKYSEGVIATSCCLGAEIPQLILHGKVEEAEKQLKWWVDIFGEDYYIELQRHKGLENIDGIGRSQEDINQTLLQFAKKHNVKVIATNDSHYVEEEDWQPHDILLCVNTGSLLEETKRFKFPSSDFFFKTKKEMERAFSDVPEALENTIEIADKVDLLKLERDILLPAFPMPDGFKTQASYLRHLSYEGAKKKYGSITPIVQERLDFELDVINKSGYEGYFLIVQDFTTTARELGVAVGPGRGSAAGSAVAYSLGITNIDPIKYDLLFERFLNPERVSMPDIDIDFDDEGRSKVIDYVIDKYGKNQVAQIITYGAMKAKTSIRDVGRVMNVPIPQVNEIAKSLPSYDKATLKALLKKDGISKDLESAMNDDDVVKARRIRELSGKNDMVGEMIRQASKLEGSIRNTGVHACGVIITPDDITKYVPVSLAKDSDMLISQFDNSVAEDSGLLKMDFLGLKTLTIIKDALENIRQSKGLEMDIELVDLEDTKTYELFQEGHTLAIFQYESAGMQKHLKDLKPNKFEDLIAMNALYRPGPLAYIGDFVARKHGKQAIKYDLDAMEEYLAETYGITVYQEQVMLLSQKLAGFTKGEADMLRKAMGKKKKKLIDEMWPKFKQGCIDQGYRDVKIIEKIWKDWEAFASYAFNKSHSTCYAFVAFQTAFLKAHYPAEFMASVLNHNKSDMDKINLYLRECKRMGIEVLGPDINESNIKFGVNKDGNIRFGLSALKGVGEGPVGELVREREENGDYEGFFDMMKRVNLRAVNKKCLESLVKGGAFDNVDTGDRSMYFTPSGNFDTLIEHGIRFGNSYKEQKISSENSLFGDLSDSMVTIPAFPNYEKWSNVLKLEKEKEVAGIYISGHPLDDYMFEIRNFTNLSLEQFSQEPVGLKAKVAGMVTEAFSATNKRGDMFAKFTLQDMTGSFDFYIRGEEFAKYNHYCKVGEVLYVEGMFSTWKNGNSYFKLQSMQLLSTLGESKINSIRLYIPLQRLDDVMLQRIEKVMEDHKGEHRLNMTIIDTETNESLKMRSKSHKVKVDYEFVQIMRELGLNTKLNA